MQICSNFSNHKKLVLDSTSSFPVAGRPGFDPWVGKIPWRKERLPTPVFWPREFHGPYSPWGRKELDMTEGNGNPFQYSCLENPRDGAAWWAAVYGVAQSWTRLKRLSSNSRVTFTHSLASL